MTDSPKNVILKGKSHKGKNRIREHGQIWNVLEERNGLLLIETPNQSDKRWIDKTNDRDFSIEEEISK